MTIIYNGSGGGIPRKTAKIFAENADTADVTEFGSTLAGQTVTTSDISVIQNEEYETGWRDAVISNLNYPLMGDMNGIQKVFSQQIAYVLQHGVPEWNNGTTYYAYDIVAKNAVLYVSLVDQNTNHDVSDGNYWAVYYDPNDTKAKRNIGELVFSLLPLTSTDLHLCDGTLISNNGIYVEFCQYIAGLYTGGTCPNVFCTEQEWQTSVATYGACGKFVYDSVNGTVRLPRLTGMVEGTLDVSALTNLTSAGLPSFTHTHTFSGTTEGDKENHTHSGYTGGMVSQDAYHTTVDGNHSHSYTSPVLSPASGYTFGEAYVSASGGYTGYVDLNHVHAFTTGGINNNHSHDYSGTTANNSAVSSIYGNSATVQPQTVKGFYYIVVSNTVATNYTIQWDEVASDLALKVDKSGDTMTGNLAIAKSNPVITMNSGLVDYTSTTAPQATINNMSVNSIDVNNNSMGGVYSCFDTNNNMGTYLYARRKISGVEKDAVWGTYIDSSGNAYVNVSQNIVNQITNWTRPYSAEGITIQGSGGTYTAPYDGWFCAQLQFYTAGNAWLYNTSIAGTTASLSATVRAFGAGDWSAGCIPVAKGNICMFSYDTTFTNGALFWVKAIGG